MFSVYVTQVQQNMRLTNFQSTLESTNISSFLVFEFEFENAEWFENKLLCVVPLFLTLKVFTGYVASLLQTVRKRKI